MGETSTQPGSTSASPSHSVIFSITPTPSPTAIPTPTPTPTLTPTPALQPSPVGQSGNWKMVFDDEFNGTSLDQSKWTTCYWWDRSTCTIATNHELELYNPDDVLVKNGSLLLQAQKRDLKDNRGKAYPYTSGMVSTGGRKGGPAPGFTFTYGFAEARVKIPAGRGLWAAFWMLPANYVDRPEIDIMEIFGQQPKVDRLTYHFNGGDLGTLWTGPDFSAGWHVFGLSWDAKAIVWYVDGVERWSFTNEAAISKVPSYLILNLAVGGDWPGPPDSNTPFPSYYEVDYVRVWQK